MTQSGTKQIKTTAEAIRHIQELRFKYLKESGKITEKTVEEYIAKCKESK